MYQTILLSKYTSCKNASQFAVKISILMSETDVDLYYIEVALFSS